MLIPIIEKYIKHSTFKSMQPFSHILRTHQGCPKKIARV
ncbi:hypothetical protein J506_3717 [Acinetobacter baumannii 625974]|uniref:Uncharacterized protein n=1 Tax=Acinetobacter baumannii 625974 TaxID=1310607 RepID=A0A009QCV3_ACIBA|nr:hypothetical protein J506_3717 [Acinetobacter baumannii 625974]